MAKTAPAAGAHEPPPQPVLSGCVLGGRGQRFPVDGVGALWIAELDESIGAGLDQLRERRAKRAFAIEAIGVQVRDDHDAEGAPGVLPRQVKPLRQVVKPVENVER